MTLSFSTHWPSKMHTMAGKPNHFVEKIWRSLPGDLIDTYFNGYFAPRLKNSGYPLTTNFMEIPPKIHTIREDQKDRWKIGNKIHPVINNRTRNRFQFAPTMEVKGVQKIKIEVFDTYIAQMYNNVPISCRMKREYNGLSRQLCYSILVNDKLLSENEVKQLAINDGFETLELFLLWFNLGFEGKIIHWTSF